MFLYTNNEISEKEKKKTIPLIITSKTIKYLGINLTKEVKDLYTVNYKTLAKKKKKLKKTQRNGKRSYVHESEELILLRCPYYPKPSIDSM